MQDVAWIDLGDPTPDELDAALPVPLHTVASERILRPFEAGYEPRPRADVHAGYLFAVLAVPVLLDGQPITGEVAFSEIDVVLTADQLVTVRKAAPGCTAVDLSRTRAAALHNGLSPAMSLYEVFDDVAEIFLAAVDRFDDDIEELEDNVDQWDAVRIRSRISELRHDLLHLRRVLTPTRDLARSILDERFEVEGEALFTRDVVIHFADAYDKLLRATDGLDLTRDLLAGVRDYHQAQVANDQNEVMKRLTVIASVLLLPTFIVGLYGQNVKGVPEYGFAHGYLWSWALIVVTTVAQVAWFRRKRWI